MQHIHLIEHDGTVQKLVVQSGLPFNAVERDTGDFFTYSHSFTDHDLKATVRVYRRPVIFDVMSGSIGAAHDLGEWAPCEFVK